MANKIFNTIMEEKISIFKNSSSNTSHLLFYDESIGRLKHPGEFGTYREKVTKEFSRFFIPRRLGIDDGFIINANDEISTQADIIIFDSNGHWINSYRKINYGIGQRIEKSLLLSCEPQGF